MIVPILADAPNWSMCVSMDPGCAISKIGEGARVAPDLVNGKDIEELFEDNMDELPWKSLLCFRL